MSAAALQWGETGTGQQGLFVQKSGLRKHSGPGGGESPWRLIAAHNVSYALGYNGKLRKVHADLDGPNDVRSLSTTHINRMLKHGFNIYTYMITDVLSDNAQERPCLETTAFPSTPSAVSGMPQRSRCLDCCPTPLPACAHRGWSAPHRSSLVVVCAGAGAGAGAGPRRRDGSPLLVFVV